MSRISTILKSPLLIVAAILLATAAILYQNHVQHERLIWWMNYLDSQVADVSYEQGSAKETIEELRLEVDEAREAAEDAENAAQQAVSAAEDD